MSIQTYNELITIQLDEIFKNIKILKYVNICKINFLFNTPHHKIETNKVN